MLVLPLLLPSVPLPLSSRVPALIRVEPA